MSEGIANAAVSELEITPEMIEAGVKVLSDQWGVIGDYAAEELAEVLFRTMLGNSPPSVLNLLHGKGPRSG